MIRIAYAAVTFSDEQIHMLGDAVTMANRAIDTKEFRTAIATRNDMQLSRAFSPTAVHELTVDYYRPLNPFTSARAYQKYSVIFLNYKCFNLGKYLPRKPIWKFWQKPTKEQIDDAYDLVIADLAGTLVHELCHQLGYEHDFLPSANRPFQIPYFVGDLVVRICDDILKQAAK